MVVWISRVMARGKKKASAPAPSAAPPVIKAVSTKNSSKQPLRRSSRRVNGLPEDSPNGCPNSVDADEEDSQHSVGRGSSSARGESTSGKEPQLGDLPPSTVVHKKFGMITCMPHGSSGNEVEAEQMIQAPQVVQAVPYMRRRTRGARNIQDAQRMVEMVLAQEGQPMSSLDDPEPCTSDPEPVGTSPFGNQDQLEGLRDPVVVEMVQEVVQGNVVYEDGVMVQEVAISWQQESSNSMDVDSVTVRLRDDDSSQQMEELSQQSDRIVPMDVGTESQDSDSCMPILVKEVAPNPPSGESDSQTSFSTDNVPRRGRRRVQTEKAKPVSSKVTIIHPANESDSSCKTSDDDQRKFGGVGNKFTTEEVNEMVLGTDLIKSASSETETSSKCDIIMERKIGESNNSIPLLGEGISEMSINHNSLKRLYASSEEPLKGDVPLSVAVNSRLSKILETGSKLDKNISNNGQTKDNNASGNSNGSGKIESYRLEVKAPNPFNKETTSDSIPSSDIHESFRILERPVTRRRSLGLVGPVKTRTKSSTNKTSNEEQTKPSVRGRKSSTDASNKRCSDTAAESSNFTVSKISTDVYENIGDTFTQGNGDTLCKSVSDDAENSGDTMTKNSGDTVTKNSSDTLTKNSSDTVTKNSSDTVTKNSSDTVTKNSSDTVTKNSSDTVTKNSSDTVTKNSGDPENKNDAAESICDTVMKNSSDTGDKSSSASSKNSGESFSKSSSDTASSDSSASNSSGRGVQRRSRHVRKSVVPAPPASPEIPVLSSPSQTLTMGSPSIPHSVHDLSMPVKVKSRWRRSSELEMGGGFAIPEELLSTPTTSVSSPSPDALSRLSSSSPDLKVKIDLPDLTISADSSPRNEITPLPKLADAMCPMDVEMDPVVLPDLEGEKTPVREEKEVAEPKTEIIVDIHNEEKLRNFEILEENEYRTERIRSKEWRRMVCDCTLTKEEIARGETGCGEDCLNRLLMIECGPRCTLGELCSNRRFQNREYGRIDVFKTEKKGYGLLAAEDIPGGSFLMEYVGEVIDNKEFRRRAKEYSKDKNRHYYFMALKSNTIIDATMKGNPSRFINHSCDPNAETQKWTVNGELRIGFFTKRLVRAGEEITFDYQFQDYGKEAQKCYCEAATCRGYIGGEPDKDQGKEWQWKEKESRGKKKERDKRREDIDVEEEIEKLCSSGLKSRAHTLNLCRIMVRAEEPQSRIQLLQLIRDGEQPCRRLFLDYHGLSLIWSWMMDTGNSNDGLQVKLEILKTLKALPIPNKTMLQDSKVLNVVEKWAQPSAVAASIAERKDRPSLEEESGSDLGDKTEQEGEEKSSERTVDSITVESVVKEESEDVKPKIELSPSEDSKSTDDGKTTENQSNGEDVKTVEPAEVLGLDDRNAEANAASKDLSKDTATCSELALELLKEWLTLKEVFRIPKKERIEQMKEHEREADKNFRNSLDDEDYDSRSGQNSYDRHWRDRNKRSDKKRSRESPEPERRSRSRYDRDRPWHDDRWRDMDVRLSKAERRKRFAQRVQQEEEEERQRRAAEEHEAEEQRRVEAEMWRQHEEQCRALGLDPIAVTNTALFQPPPPQYLDPVTNTWVAFPAHPGDPNFVPGEFPPEYGHPTPFVGEAPPHLLPPGFPRMFAAPGDSNLPPNEPVIPVSVAPTGQPIPTLSAGQPVPFSASQVAQVPLPPGPILYQGQEVPIYHQADGVPPTPFLPPVPGDPQLAQQAPVAPYLPMVPMKLPPKWKSAKDAEGRTYYYHIKTRVSQWEPPMWVPAISQPAESESSSDTSDDDDDEDSESSEEDVEEKEEEEEEELDEDIEAEDEEEVPAIQQGLGMAAHHQQLMMADPDYPTFSPVPSAADERRKRRAGLVQERIISPRREEDRVDKRIYRQNKEKLRRQKEKMRKRENAKSAKSAKKRHHGGAKSSTEKPLTAAADTSSDAARRIKDAFRVSMASVIVQHLNPYRKPDCKLGRITNTEDFKHLARKLTHFVMVKELKHCRAVDDLECNDNVKHKARDFIKKYMAKFGDIYQRPKDED